MFHNSRGYGSHLFSDELKSFDVKIDVIPNRIGNCMAFFLKQKSLY